MFRFPKRAPVPKSEEALPKLTEDSRGKQIAEIMNGVAETLAKSTLYFTPENLAILGSAPNVSSLLERLDALTRATLLDGTLRPEQQAKFLAFVECAGDLKAGAEAARLAAQIFRLLHDYKTPISGMVPLKKVADSALRTLRTSASAISSGNEATARMALTSLGETETIGREVMELIPNLAAYRSPTICRMMIAALYAVLVSAHCSAEIASNLVLPHPEQVEPLKKIAPLTDLQDSEIVCFSGLSHSASKSRNDVICMPTPQKKR